MREFKNSTLVRSSELISPVRAVRNPSFLNFRLIYFKDIKRIVDLVLSLSFVVTGLPFYIIFGLLIKFNSKGPVLFKQIRTGLENNPFLLYKFRSMHLNAEADSGPVWTALDDSRITKVGRFLRRFRLDELPQLLNVIKGDMSLVGPRPERPYFVEKLMEEFPSYVRRMKVRPGITGWAQIKLPYDEHFDDVGEKLKYDSHYIENVSFWLDLKIIFKTIWVMMSGKGR